MRGSRPGIFLEERRKKKTFYSKQIEHPFSLGNINIISDKNAVYEREIVLFLVQIWLPQLVVFFLVNRTFLWLFLAVSQKNITHLSLQS